MIFLSIANLSQEHKLIDMQVWRNWQTRMVQVAPLRCKFISVTISCKLWIKRYAPPRFSPLNRVKIQREKLNMHPWRNWQTRMVQVHIFERKCRFNSCRVHHEKQWQTHNIRIEILCLITINLLVLI